MSVHTRVLLFLLATGAWSVPARAEPPEPKPVPVDIPALIDKLVEVSGEDVGYSATVSGSAFTPLDARGNVSTALLFQRPLVRSDTMRLLVKQGAVALPHLIAHLDDKRKTGITVRHGGFLGGMFFEDRMDFNERTEKPPLGQKEVEKPDDGGRKSHTVTVGDLCFVAIGQIVNRDFDAVRYQPTAIIYVTSPTLSPALREKVKNAWGALTPEQHRASLVADFLKPDWEDRRVGACKRLAYYYPDVLEPLALEFLAQKSYSSSEVQTFVRKVLYKEADPKRCQALFDAYLAKHGEESRDGILLYLFDDLDTLEAHEEKRHFPPLTEYADQPRQLLIQLYGKPKDVRSKDKPRAEAISDGAKARVVEKGLVYDTSEKIDRAVRDLLAANGDDAYLAGSCICRLVGRGYDEEIEAYLRRQLKQATEEWDRQRLQSIEEKLGWTRLHVAVDRGDADTIRSLLRTKADASAAARNGKTPLHLAAQAGSGEVVRLLVDAGASLDPKEKGGLTPVQLAVREDHLEVVRFLAARKCAVPDVLVAAAAGRPDEIERLFKADEKALAVKTQSGQTPLHLAAWVEDGQVAEVLIARKADVEAIDQAKMTPLHVAAHVGSDEVVRQLVRAGASVTATVGDSGVEPLHLAAERGHVKAAQVLLDAKASPKARVKRTGQTPLHLAAATESVEMVDLLLKHGADVGASNELELTPLHDAAFKGRIAVAERLLAARADLEAKGKEGRYTPLYLAVAGEQVAMVKFLLSRKAEVKVKSLRGTPLDLARELGNQEIIKLLEGKEP